MAAGHQGRPGPGRPRRDLAVGPRAAPLPGPDRRRHPHPDRVHRGQLRRHGRRPQRAMTGVRGVSRLRPAEILTMVTAWSAAVVALVALAAAGVSYSQYPTTLLI